MVIGNPSSFAIESQLTKAYARLSVRALGYFVIHLGGRPFGVREPKATYLAISFYVVGQRLENCGKHVAPFSEEPDADKIAYAYRNAFYADVPDDSHFGIPLAEFKDIAFSNKLCWAPDGDAAFDDGSYVLQFDVDQRVRLIGFKSQNYSYDPTTLIDIWLPADEYYEILKQWSDAFLIEWIRAPKSADDCTIFEV